MTAFVFVGPTLPIDLARRALDVQYLPPASRGDVLRAALKRPKVIGIIDGFFEFACSVWHKEVLWALSRGIFVFGSSSMGALRAAELAPFGMKGIGAIFEEFKEGLLLDDDEVAVSHAPAELGYRPISEAMVNIRATLKKAASCGVIQADTATKLQRIAKLTFFAERTFSNIGRTAVENGMNESEIRALDGWLSKNRVDVKKDDALALLRAIGNHLDSGSGEMAVDFTFEHTEQWERFFRSVL